MQEQYRIWFISDTHGAHHKLYIPSTDIVICCGDEANDFDPAINYHEALQFFEWFNTLQIEHKIYIPGNHSVAVWNGMIRPEDFPDITFLIHRGHQIGTMRIFGSPYTPKWGRCCAFGIDRDRTNLIWDSLPNCDILATHGPPYGICDLTADRRTGELTQVGDNYLREAVNKINPLVHAFGHLHDEAKHGIKNFGVRTFTNNTKYVNCSVMRFGSKNINNGIFMTYTNDNGKSIE